MFANYTFKTLVLSLPKRRPVILPPLSIFSNKQESPLEQKRKRKGDKGSHCLSPLVEVILPLTLLLRRIEKVTDLIPFITFSTQPSHNPIFHKIACKKFHSTLPYALYISSFKAIFYPLLNLPFFIVFSPSKPIIMLS